MSADAFSQPPVRKPSALPMGKIPVPEPGTNPIVRHIEDAILFLMELQRRADEKAKLKTLPWHLINDAGISLEELEADLKKPFWRFPSH
ncbi:MAG: hypothetical protein NXI16_16085 [Alphaproteobacteria bacterium]|nr:hypothetical protein [Alphaproteobacteria bacterium]